MFRNFGQKNGKCLKVLRMYSYEVKRSQRSVKGRNIERSTNGYLEFSKFSLLSPKIQILICQKCLQNTKFWSYPKNWNLCYIATYAKQAYKISKQFLYFSLCNGKKKTGKGDDVTFFTRFLASLIIVVKINEIFPF